MEEFKTDWGKQELKAYLMLYFANADYVETDDEKEMIKSKVGQEDFKDLHKEFDGDNDYARIQKITQAAERLKLSDNKMESVLKEIKEMFAEDHELDILERNLYRGLKHLFN